MHDPWCRWIRSTAAAILASSLIGCHAAATTSSAAATTPPPPVATQLAAGSKPAKAPATPTAAAPAAAPKKSLLIKARPYTLHVPKGYDQTKPTPFVILLHGYALNGDLENQYLRLGELVDKAGFLYATPDGTSDGGGNHFWNATDACCDFGQTGVDDVAYIGAVMDDVEQRYNVDAKRVYVIGHSNGAYMANRVACDLSPRVAAFVSLAGAQWNDLSRCKPSEAVSMVEVHGDADPLVPYGGGRLTVAFLQTLAKQMGLKLPNVKMDMQAFPSAETTASDWATLDGCTGKLTPTGTSLDLDTGLAGAETTVERAQGCKGSDVELWTIKGGGHAPDFAHPPDPPAFAEAVYAFFKANPKP
jgi:polyhydroxybutyrate depolymerase